MNYYCVVSLFSWVLRGWLIFHTYQLLISRKAGMANPWHLCLVKSKNFECMLCCSAVRCISGSFSSSEDLIILVPRSHACHWWLCEINSLWSISIVKGLVLVAANHEGWRMLVREEKRKEWFYHLTGRQGSVLHVVCVWFHLLSLISSTVYF